MSFVGTLGAPGRCCRFLWVVPPNGSLAMPDAPASSARQRFARDLRRIREHREVSLASVHAATQIPEPHLESFEDGRLFEESTMTDVYLKAFVQAYADAIGV